MRNPRTGEPLNYRVDENGDKIPGSENYTSKTEYLDKTLYNIEVDENGNARYTHEYTQKKHKLTPFKKFSKISMKKYWEALNNANMLNNIRPHQKSAFYIKLKSLTWEYLKYYSITKIMKVAYPEDKTFRTSLEKSNSFKIAIEQLITEILSTPIDKTM